MSVEMVAVVVKRRLCFFPNPRVKAYKVVDPQRHSVDGVSRDSATRHTLSRRR